MGAEALVAYQGDNSFAKGMWKKIGPSRVAVGSKCCTVVGKNHTLNVAEDCSRATW